MCGARRSSLGSLHRPPNSAMLQRLFPQRPRIFGTWLGCLRSFSVGSALQSVKIAFTVNVTVASDARRGRMAREGAGNGEGRGERWE
jgi:hypothetical protein